LLSRYPHLTILPCRGNLDTRLRKLDSGEYDAILLAAAGLKRLGLAARIRAVLPQSEALPAPAQGVLGIEIRSGDAATSSVVAVLEHKPTRLAITAERALALALEGGCKVPIAAYCETVVGNQYLLRAQVASLDGKQVLVAQAQGPLESAEQARRLGLVGADMLIEQGARDVVGLAI
jgi:hydroxymethylbilane synthase